MVIISNHNIRRIFVTKVVLINPVCKNVLNTEIQNPNSKLNKEEKNGEAMVWKELGSNIDSINIWNLKWKMVGIMEQKANVMNTDNVKIVIEV